MARTIEGPRPAGGAYAIGVSVRLATMEAAGDADAARLLVSEYEADGALLLETVGRLSATEPERER